MRSWMQVVPSSFLNFYLPSLFIFLFLRLLVCRRFLYTNSKCPIILRCKIHCWLRHRLLALADYLREYPRLPLSGAYPRYPPHPSNSSLVNQSSNCPQLAPSLDLRTHPANASVRHPSIQAAPITTILKSLVHQRPECWCRRAVQSCTTTVIAIHWKSCQQKSWIGFCRRMNSGITGHRYCPITEDPLSYQNLMDVARLCKYFSLATYKEDLGEN